MADQIALYEKNEGLIAVLLAGKEIYQQIKRNLFVSEIEIAENL
jgi:hypothetical protein